MKLLIAVTFATTLAGCGSTTSSSDESPRLELPVSCSVAAAPSAKLLVDDFEDGDTALDGHANLHGNWYVNNDGTGTQVPPLAKSGATAALLSEQGAPGSESHSLYTSGTGFERWGAFVATRLNSARSKACSYDLSGSSGIQLEAKGSGNLRINLGSVETTPIVDGGDCTAEQCSDYGALVPLELDWTHIELAFDELSQPEWATPSDWDATQLLRVSFWSEQSDFEFWIDDVGFY